MSIVNGFAGLRVTEKGASIAPYVPTEWNGYKFKFVYHNRLIRVEAGKANVSVELLNGEDVSITVYGKQYKLSENNKLNVSTEV